VLIRRLCTFLDRPVAAVDVVYNECHMYVGDTTPESRKNWVSALDRLAALELSIVVAGHKKPGAPDSPSAIEDTKCYLSTLIGCRKPRRPTKSCSTR
jgi:hypothetical protein